MVSVDEMRAGLLTLTEVREHLATTEPISEVGFAVGESVSFQVDSGWNHALDNIEMQDPVNATVRAGGQEYRLTREALLEAGSFCGLTRAYVSKTPAALIEPHLNYWFREGLGSKEFQILSTNGLARAIAKSTIVPFSNLRLLDEVEQGITAKYGAREILVDQKYRHTFAGTTMRLVVPSLGREILNSGTDDDQWSLGIQIDNSLIGFDQTALSGYLFRWVCTNGAITTHSGSGTWSRKASGQGDDVYEWARESVDGILGGLEPALDDIQSLTEVNLEGDVSIVLRDLFEQYKVPGRERTKIVENMVDETNLTMYTVMQAITAAANDRALDPAHATRLMTLGGDLAHIASDRCDSCRRLIPA